MEAVEDLTQKLLATHGVQHLLERLHQRAVPAPVRLLEGIRAALPLGMIPISLVWTAVVFFLPVTEPIKLIRLYALGLLAMLVFAGVAFTLRTLVAKLRLKDAILEQMAVLQGLAYHPNTVLRRSLSARGWVTLGEYQLWYEKQRDILQTRADDFEAAIENARRGVEAVDLDAFPPGARAFLER